MWAQAMGRADELEPEIQEGGLSLIGPKGGEYLNPKYTAQCAELGRAERLAKALLITPESQLRSAGATEPAKEPEDVITTLREKNIRDRMSR